MWVCVCASAYACVYSCTWVTVYLCVYVCVCMHMCVCLARLCVYVLMCVCACVYVQRAYIYMYINNRHVCLLYMVYFMEGKELLLPSLKLCLHFPKLIYIVS